MDSTILNLMIDFHIDHHRQGPGSDEDTQLALAMTRIAPTQPIKVADIGCGTGAASLILAKHLNAHVSALDFAQPFLTKLEERAQKAHLSDAISTHCASMEDLPFAEQQFDLIWAEGAIYNMGFANGLRAWRKFLKPHGWVGLSEITWLGDDRPQELTEYWENAYPEITTVTGNIAKLEQAGFQLKGYFPLPPNAWLEHYYDPLMAGADAFLARHHHSAEAQMIVDEERTEIELYQRHQAHYSYGFYIAQRRD